jgi:multiple antibiotic resistance protein
MLTAPLTAIPAGEMLIFFFLLLGPIKIIGPFVKLTAGAEPRLCRQLAVRGILLAAGALALATLLGDEILNRYHTFRCRCWPLPAD